MIKRSKISSSEKGMIRCARYAFMPNRLTFCGPDKNQDLFYYCQRREANQGLSLILKEFQTLYPYLKFIARANGIRDPFDEKVVEAYWIGNALLENANQSNFYRHLSDSLEMKKKMALPAFRRLVEKVSLKPKPHHNFHVLGVWKRTGYLDIAHTLASMDLCRINWGRVEKVEKKNIVVAYRPLILENEKICLGKTVRGEITYQLGGKSFLKGLRKGHLISFHWGFACEKISREQARKLDYYTQESINAANKGEFC